jgi:prophage regulatory protein
MTSPLLGFYRLNQIIGDTKSNPPITPIIPISKSSWWEGVKNGLYPKPLKLGPRTTVWKVEDIKSLIDQITTSQGEQS